jgi:hypothetical protein
MWDVRLYVYGFIVANERPPTSAETAAHFALTVGQVEHIFQQLNARHALFLEPGQLTIRMAHPFAGVPTSFVVKANGHRYYANCAWDALGIPAMLHTDAIVEAHYSDTHESLVLTVQDERVSGPLALVHFLLPFKHWYDDLVFT